MTDVIVPATWGTNPVAAVTTAANGTRLAYEELGHPGAPLLLLVQGYSAQLVGWPSGFCHALAAAGFRVIRFDNRDIGLSQRFPDAVYSLADMADDAAGLIKVLGGGPAHVVGQSMGGMIVQELAIHHPGLVASLTVMYSTACARRHFVTPITELGAPAPVGSREEAVAQYVANESHVRQGRYPVDLGYLWEIGHQYVSRGWDPEGVNRQRRAMQADRDRAEDLRLLNCPTLVVHGSDDPLISVDGGREIASLVPGARLDVVEGMVHAIPHQLWHRFATEIAEIAGVIGTGTVGRPGFGAGY
ncbi:alpha/beta fold hydrolase [Actinomyces sp.]|uniref:alpha/beta fold hydrolase n=1 Tax=Actinomyces sp. TaxID=29317 RepID=UPI0026DBA1E0|nr:alpha/beta hydrolase [Actinomyces sp.]MDO4901633.1 alpha/beta hydrolase [Actinomyces sp.]